MDGVKAEGRVGVGDQLKVSWRGGGGRKMRGKGRECDKEKKKTESSRQRTERSCRTSTSNEVSAGAGWVLVCSVYL